MKARNALNLLLGASVLAGAGTAQRAEGQTGLPADKIDFVFNGNSRPLNFAHTYVTNHTDGFGVEDTEFSYDSQRTNYIYSIVGGRRLRGDFRFRDSVTDMDGKFSFLNRTAVPSTNSNSIKVAYDVNAPYTNGLVSPRPGISKVEISAQHTLDGLPFVDFRSLKKVVGADTNGTTGIWNLTGTWAPASSTNEVGSLVVNCQPMDYLQIAESGKMMDTPVDLSQGMFPGESALVFAPGANILDTNGLPVGTVSGASPNFTVSPARGFIGPYKLPYAIRHVNPERGINEKLADMEASGNITNRFIRPVARDAFFGVPRNANYQFDFNDVVTDNEGAGFTVTPSIAEGQGTLTPTLESLVWTYKSPNAHGDYTVSFQAQLIDPLTNYVSNFGNVTFRATNAPPVNLGLEGGDILVTDNNLPVSIPPVNYSDLNGDPCELQITQNPAPETGAILGGQFIPFPNFVGPASFRYRVGDGFDVSDERTANIDVRFVPTPVVLGNSYVQGVEDTSLTNRVLAIFDNRNLTNSPVYRLVGPMPQKGTVQLDSSTGGYVYIPNPDANGLDSFGMEVADVYGSFAVGTNFITVEARDDAPSLGGSRDFETLRGHSLDMVLGATDIDTLPQDIKYEFPSTTEGGSLQLVGTDTLRYTPRPDFVSKDKFNVWAFSVDSLTGDTNYSLPAEIAVKIFDTNSAPVVSSPLELSGVMEDAPVRREFPANDLENDPLSFVFTSMPTNGTVSIDGNNFVYVPMTNYHGVGDSFGFIAGDGRANSLEGLVFFNDIGSVDDAPNAYAITNYFSRLGGVGFFKMDDSADGTDPSSLIVEIAQQPEKGRVNVLNNSYVFTPDSVALGTFTAWYQVFDDGNYNNASVPAAIQLVVTNIPSPADTIHIGGALPFNTYFVGTPLTDTDGDPVTYRVLSGPEVGDLSVVPGGLEYICRTNGLFGTYPFTYEADDGHTNTIGNGFVTTTPARIFQLDSDTNSPGNALLSAEATVGYVFVPEVTTSLLSPGVGARAKSGASSSWTPLTNAAAMVNPDGTNFSGVLRFQVPRLPGESAVFYRLIAQPVSPAATNK